jgi:hypothetical protein
VLLSVTYIKLSIFISPPLLSFNIKFKAQKGGRMGILCLIYM